jgi:hypothetical protein
MTEQIMSQAIADYIIEVLGSTTGPLDEVKLFVRGAFPSGMVRQDHYPMIEVFVGTELEGPEGTGGHYEQTYVGVIAVSITLAHGVSGGDQIVKIGERVAHVPSYDLAKSLVHAIEFELQKHIHRDMSSLGVVDEVVIRFTVSAPRELGMDRELRSNNWDNFALIPFEVETERRRYE